MVVKTVYACAVDVHATHTISYLLNWNGKFTRKILTVSHKKWAIPLHKFITAISFQQHFLGLLSSYAPDKPPGVKQQQNYKCKSCNFLICMTSLALNGYAVQVRHQQWKQIYYTKLDWNTERHNGVHHHQSCLMYRKSLNRRLLSVQSSQTPGGLYSKPDLRSRPGLYSRSYGYYMVYSEKIVR